MSIKQSASSTLCYGIVVGGGSDDPAPDQSNGLRVYFPTIHSKDVDFKHLAFSPRVMSPDRLSMQSFSGGLDYGSLVVAYKDTGSNQCQIIGLASDLNNREVGIPGNDSLIMANPALAAIFRQDMGMNRPPRIQEAMEGGAKIFKAIEQGAHFHDLLKGLPTNGAIFPLAGLPIDPIKNIKTAISATNQILSGDIIGALPGVAMSLGGLLNKLTAAKNYNKRLKKSMKQQQFDALSSISALTQSMEQAEGTGFLTGARVDEDTYTENAIELLSQCENLTDMIDCMARLQSDVSLMGTENLPPVIVKQETPFGTEYQSFSPTGQQIRITPAQVVAAASSLQSLMSGAGFPSAIPGVNLFGSSAGTILSMIQRLPSSEMGQAIALLQQLNTSGPAQILNLAVRFAQNGNPINAIK